MSNCQKLCVFDLDGTLNQTHLYAVPAHQKALAAFGVTDKTPAQIQGTFGARHTEYVPYLLSNPNVDPETERKYLDMVAEYENQFIITNGKPFDGVTGSLSRLKQNGYTTAICSNASLRYIKNCVEKLGLSPYIDELQPLMPDMTKADTLKLLLDRLSPAHAVMVGDRRYDRQAAQANDIPFIGCLYGYNPEEVKDSPYTVSSAGELYDVIASLF